MKKNYLLIALLFISGLSFGQYFSNHGLQTTHNNSEPIKSQQLSKGNTETQKLSNKKQMDSIFVNLYTGTTAIPYAKEIFTYTNAGNVATIISFENDNQVMVKDTKEEYTYDANGRVVERHLLEWDNSTSQWGEKSKEITSYTTTSYTITSFIWDVSTSLWSKINKKETLLNQNSLDSLTLSYSWNNQWNLNSRTHYTYNSNNDITLSLREVKNGNNWVNNGKTEWTYDTNYNLLKASNFIWDSQNNVYINSYIHKSGYDSQNNRIYDVDASYDISNSSWNYYDSTIYTYSANADLDSSFDYSWNGTSGSWELESKSLMTYDNNYALSDLILPMAMFDDDDLMYFNHMLTKMEGYGNSNGPWELAFVYDIYYSDFVATSIDQAESNSISIAPNPAQDYFMVNMEGQQLIDINIYDATGRLVKTQETTSDSKINIRDLKSGIYFLQIIDAKKQVYSSKLIKR